MEFKIKKIKEFEDRFIATVEVGDVTFKWNFKNIDKEIDTETDTPLFIRKIKAKILKKEITTEKTDLDTFINRIYDVDDVVALDEDIIKNDVGLIREKKERDKLISDAKKEFDDTEREIMLLVQQRQALKTAKRKKKLIEDKIAEESVEEDTVPQ
jgi:hypothetical protein